MASRNGNSQIDVVPFAVQIEFEGFEDGHDLLKVCHAWVVFLSKSDPLYSSSFPRLFNEAVTAAS